MANAKILIVGDENTAALDIRKRLENLGYTIPAIASSIEEAIVKVAETRPNLVLMDIALNKSIIGMMAAEKIRVSFDIPVVFLVEPADDKAGPMEDLNEDFIHIPKPYEGRELNFTIEKALYKHKMEMKFRRSFHLFSSTLSCIGEAVVTIDDNRFIKFMNPAAEALIGLKMEDAAGRPLSDAFNNICEDLDIKVEEFIKKVIQEGFVMGIVDQARLITFDGRELAVDIIGSPIKDERKSIIGIVLIFIDITERTASWNALQKAYETQIHRTI